MPSHKEALKDEAGAPHSLSPLNSEGTARDIIVVGASAGGVQALMALLSSLPGNLPAIVAVVLHRGSMPGYLAQVLARESTLPIVEPTERVIPTAGTVYLAPADRHLVFEGEAVTSHRGPKEHSTRPAVDPLFRSAAAIHANRVVGVILTGAGDDGVNGLIEITKAGGLALTQDPDEATMPYMPLHALHRDHVCRVFSLKELGSALQTLASGGPVEGGFSPDDRLHGPPPWYRTTQRSRHNITPPKALQ